MKQAPDAQVILTHLDGKQSELAIPGVIFAEDIGRYRL
jgi:hypothetical protein